MGLIDAICERLGGADAYAGLQASLRLDDPADALRGVLSFSVRFWAAEEQLHRSLYGLAEIDPAATSGDSACGSEGPGAFGPYRRRGRPPAPAGGDELRRLRGAQANRRADGDCCRRPREPARRPAARRLIAEAPTGRRSVAPVVGSST